MSLLLALIAIGFGIDTKGLPPGVRDLDAASTTATTVTLTWTAPEAWNDLTDEFVDATDYDLRYWEQDPFNYDGDWFADATSAGPLPAPLRPGDGETFTVLQLTPGTKYFFCILTMYGTKPGSLSNFAVGTTTTDTVPPQAVTTLHVSAVGETSVTLAWTAPGDFEQPSQTLPSAVAHYELKVSAEGPIGAGQYSTADPFPPSLLWPPRNPGQLETDRVVSGLEPGRTYWFALKSFDAMEASSVVSNSPSASIAGMVVQLGGRGHSSSCPISSAGASSGATLLVLLGLFGFSRR